MAWRHAVGRPVCRRRTTGCHIDSDAIVQLARNWPDQVGVIVLNAGISLECIASVLTFAIEHSADTNVTELTVWPTAQPW